MLFASVSLLGFGFNTGSDYTKYPLSLNPSQNKQQLYLYVFESVILCVHPESFSLVFLW